MYEILDQWMSGRGWGLNPYLERNDMIESQVVKEAEMF